MNEEKLPPGWDRDRIQRVIEHYESQTEDEAAAEDEAAFAEPQSIDALRAELVHFCRTEEGKEFALAARAVEKLSEEALRALHEELLELRAQAKRAS